MEYGILDPRGESDLVPPMDLNPRVNDLSGKTIGLFAHFKQHWPMILEEVARQLKERFPSAQFSHYQYPVDLAEVINDANYKASFEEWFSGVDTVIAGYGDAGSCAMYVAYNAAAIEKLGKPVVMLTNKDLLAPTRAGAALRNVPGLRLVPMTLTDLSGIPSFDDVIENIIRPGVTPFIDDIIAALTNPVTEEEKALAKKHEEEPRIIFKGDLRETNQFLYKKGRTCGMSVIPPTEEAVREMLTGTELPPDYVVAKLPPRLGKATVEKIAINAVMAGCLPTHMPVLIAAVQARVDPKVSVEAYTCSVASFAPLTIINGPIRHDLNINTGGALLSPYYKAGASIAHALSLITLNIGGVRPGIEDMSVIGHESRLGVCFGENEEASPWEPLHTDFGLSKDDSSVTIIFFNQRQAILGESAAEILSCICNMELFGQGNALILSPAFAKVLADEGLTKKDVVSYILEYARKPASECNVRWIWGNHHEREGMVKPMDPSHSLPLYFYPEHIVIAVGGSTLKAAGTAGASFDSIGTHGRPVNKKIELPASWDELVKRYKDIVPTYAQY